MCPQQVKCPICQKEVKWEGNSFRPFCSERCRLMDLGKWASGDYAIPDTTHSIPNPDDNNEDDVS